MQGQLIHPLMVRSPPKERSAVHLQCCEGIELNRIQTRGTDGQSWLSSSASGHVAGSGDERDRAAVSKVMRWTPTIREHGTSKFGRVERSQKNRFLVAPTLVAHRRVTPATIRKVDTEVTRPRSLRVEVLHLAS